MDKDTKAMIVEFGRWMPENLSSGIYYLIKINKGDGLRCSFLIEIVKLPEEFHPIFYDQYDPRVIEKKFLTINFFDFERFRKPSIYSPVKGMAFTMTELRQLVKKGLAECFFDFIKFNKSRIIVLIPIRRGLSILYKKVLSECEQEIGYSYNQSYLEKSIHVIES